MKEAKHLFTEKYKTLMKEMEVNMMNWRDANVF